MKKIKYVAFLIAKSIAFIIFFAFIGGVFNHGLDDFVGGWPTAPWFVYFITWTVIATIFVTPATISEIKKMIGQKENASI
jgi:hypothetical protein